MSENDETKEVVVEVIAFRVDKDQWFHIVTKTRTWELSAACLSVLCGGEEATRDFLRKWIPIP
jgi:hypothetical protein